MWGGGGGGGGGGIIQSGLEERYSSSGNSNHRDSGWQCGQELLLMLCQEENQRSFIADAG